MSLIKLAVTTIKYEKGKDYDYLYLKMPKYNYTFQISKNYLGGYLNSKKPRPGENWTRGNDLSDGKNNEKTLFKILNDIIRHESN